MSYLRSSVAGGVCVMACVASVERDMAGATDSSGKPSAEPPREPGALCSARRPAGLLGALPTELSTMLWGDYIFITKSKN